MTRIETNRTEQTAQRAPHPAYWLVAKNAYGWIEVLTLDPNGEEMLPVFGHEEEAEMFLRLGDVGDGWRARESSVGELVSVLYGPCAGVKEVALDPLPEMVAERTVGQETSRAPRAGTGIQYAARGRAEPEDRGGLDRAAPEVTMHSKEEGMPVWLCPSSPRGASHSPSTSYGIGFPRRNILFLFLIRDADPRGGCQTP